MRIRDYSHNLAKASHVSALAALSSWLQSSSPLRPLLAALRDVRFLKLAQLAVKHHARHDAVAEVGDHFAPERQLIDVYAAFDVPLRHFGDGLPRAVLRQSFIREHAERLEEEVFGVLMNAFVDDGARIASAGVDIHPALVLESVQTLWLFEAGGNCFEGLLRQDGGVAKQRLAALIAPLTNGLSAVVIT
jgi:hypothetical protein